MIKRKYVKQSLCFPAIALATYFMTVSLSALLVYMYLSVKFLYYKKIYNWSFYLKLFREIYEWVIKNILECVLGVSILLMDFRNVLVGGYFFFI